MSLLQQRGMERFQGGTGLRLNAELELVGRCLTLLVDGRTVWYPRYDCKNSSQANEDECALAETG